MRLSRPLLLLMFGWPGLSLAQSQLGSDIDGTYPHHAFGASVSLSVDGSRVGIGALISDGFTESTGECEVYEWNGGAWVQLGSDINGLGDYGEYFCRSISLSADGTRVAAGAPGPVEFSNDEGYVSVYDWNGASWVPLGLNIFGETEGGQSGYSVSLSADGTRVAIGARYNNGTSGVAGHARVYEWNGVSWVQLGSDIDGEAVGDQSGYSVSLSADGTRVAIGAPENDGTADGAGHVRVYDWNGAAWLQLGSDIDGEAESDQFGHSVSLSADGTRVAIGAFKNDGIPNDAGHTRVYEWGGLAWVQLGSDIDGEAAGDRSGYAVSLSADGSRVAIGAIDNNGAAAFAGHVRVYDWNGAAWVQLGSDMDGRAQSDQLGRSVALSADGMRVAMGSSGGMGYVRVYTFGPFFEGGFEAPAPVCEPGEAVSCYPAPPATLNVGLCTSGLRTCDTDGQWGECTGWVGPEPDVCDGQDNDCDGDTDPGCEGSDCNPLDSDGTCNVGLGCYIDFEGCRETVCNADCGDEGSGRVGSPCVNGSDCGSGLQCIDTGAQDLCLETCDPGDIFSCGLKSVCGSLGLFIDGQEIGVCSLN